MAEVSLGCVAAALSFGIACEVFGAGKDSVSAQWFRGVGSALVAFDDGAGEFADQRRIFAEGLPHASPAGIAGDAQHRGEGPMHTRGRDLFGSCPAHRFNLVRIPACRHAQLFGEDCRAGPEGVSVDAVVADDQGNAETCLRVDGLGRSRKGVRTGVQDRADVPVHNQVVQVAGACVELHHLPDLFFQGHAGEQVVDAFFNRQIRVAVGELLAADVLAHTCSFLSSFCGSWPISVCL